MKKKLQDYFRIFSEHRGITVQEHEEIFDAVYKKVKRAESPTIWARFRSPMAVGSIVVAACVLLAFPAVLLHGKYRQSRSTLVTNSDDYSARGGVTAPFVVIECTGLGERGRCNRNSVMVFKVRPSRDQKYFSAFARHIESNAVVWYFPATKDGRSLFVEETDAGQILVEGIAIGDDHALGKYEVISIFSDSELHWDDIRDLFDDNGHLSGDNYTVIKKEIQIEK